MRTRRIPYTANFSTSPARIMDPAHGASTWARGSQIWKGTRGVLIANDRKIASQRIRCVSNEKSVAVRVSKSVLPAV